MGEKVFYDFFGKIIKFFFFSLLVDFPGISAGK